MKPISDMTQEELIAEGLVAPCERCGYVDNIGMILDDAHRRGDRVAAETVVAMMLASVHTCVQFR